MVLSDYTRKIKKTKFPKISLKKTNSFVIERKIDVELLHN